MSKSIDKIVVDTGKVSHNKELSKYQTTYCQTNKMINLMDRKRKLINLKVVIEDGLAKITKESRRILTLFYIDGITATLIAQLLGISIRTFFRQKTKALNEFCVMLEDLGYGKQFFETNYLGESWFEVIYNQMTQTSYEEDSLNEAFVRKILGDIGKVPVFCNTYV